MMKKRIFNLAAGLGAAALIMSALIPAALAAVNVTAGPAALVSSPLALAANSSQTGLFSFSLSADSGETLSGVSVTLAAANASTTVSGSHIASVSLYQDNGSNSFNPGADALVGAQTSVNIGAPTVITPSTTTPASGEFYVSLATSGSWSGNDPADSINATMPSNAILTSANSPVTAAVTTAAITAPPASASVTIAKYLNGVPATAALTDNASFSVNISSDGTNGNFNLGPVGVNTGSPYQIVTSLPSGSNSFSAFENIFGAVGSSCSSNLPYTLTGYTESSVSLADAASQAPTLTPPSFSNLSGNEYVIVWNGSCGSSNPAPTPTSTTVSISTQLSASAVATSTAVYDAAVLSNATANASGTVTYNVYSGSMCSGTPVFTSAQTVANGIVPVSASWTPGASGTYNWQAVYSGDANNNGATSACGSEVLTVSQSQPGGVCSDGLINGRIYHLTGSDNYYIAQNCSLQTLFSGKINFHGRNNKFKGLINRTSVKGLLNFPSFPQFPSFPGFPANPAKPGANNTTTQGKVQGNNLHLDTNLNVNLNTQAHTDTHTNTKSSAQSIFNFGKINFGKLFGKFGF